MNKQPYAQQAITAYLLGSLPADEAERFDELSFTDDDFAAQLQAAEKDLADAYVNGELTGEELRQFESHYLASPIRRSKVEFAQAFQTFAKERSEAAPHEFPLAQAGSKATISEFFSNLFRGMQVMPKWGFALAALVLIGVASWLLVVSVGRQAHVEQARDRGPQIQNSATEPGNTKIEKVPQNASNGNVKGPEPETRQEPTPRPATDPAANAEQKQPQRPETPKSSRTGQSAIASFVLTPLLRGAGQVDTLTIPKDTGSVDLRLELEPNDIQAFRVELKDQSGRAAGWSSGVVKAKGAGETKSLNIRIPATLLRSGQTYMLNVSSEGKGKPENFSNYSFKAVVK